MLKGKFQYNIIGIGSNSTLTNTLSEPTSTDIHRSTAAPSTHVGAGLYHITSHISHSCSPNTSLRFVNMSSEIEVVADTDLNEGDEIFVSWIVPGEKDVRARREELHTKYKFRCQVRCREF